MKKYLQFALFFLAIGFLTSCGSEAATDAENAGEEAVENVEAAATEAAETMEEATDQSGPEYTSMYVCPMHCAGSGSAEPGTCPSCGMDYVMNENAGLEAGGDSESHEGHNH
ncbi:MAG: hypothetical protein KDC24_12060 [Saprospiraceae bacterium]|nr:hypothetical protein [Saprospiraceae bacterium]